MEDFKTSNRLKKQHGLEDFLKRQQNCTGYTAKLNKYCDVIVLSGEDSSS